LFLAVRSQTNKLLHIISKQIELLMGILFEWFINRLECGMHLYLLSFVLIQNKVTKKKSRKKTCLPVGRDIQHFSFFRPDLAVALL
jgi:hypothetical protein